MSHEGYLRSDINPEINARLTPKEVTEKNKLEQHQVEETGDADLHSHELDETVKPFDQTYEEFDRAKEQEEAKKEDEEEHGGHHEREDEFSDEHEEKE